ncbi:transcription termination factor MTEF18, mitochondrial-like [Abrus precatorius]|uniref:Transcription termination factor MTEF18, mitochondrial-like n=1 Tax=Abrus precatorius TaxID=3816 RepID=A0A8B8JI77_ABRPR|nr:transcription termination factor MTEF18, mitochondrial-like [Abrus precatorius]
MISQLCRNHNFLFFPCIHEKPFATQHPFSVSLKAPSFCGSKVTHVPRVSRVHSIQSYYSVKRVSRYVTAKVQDVLLDYLHSSRGYSFIDAEFISKNSPFFVQGLVSEFHAQDDDVARCLRKFLRYNPINEFEPFFESLGISPHELHLFLPRGMMFLSDDHVLLENFHALSNYGIPRNRIGKIYKETKEVFGYPSELLLSKIRAYENLCLSRSVVIKLAVCCPSLLVGETSRELVMILDWLKKIGIEHDWIGKYLSCSKSYDLKRMLDAMQFLHKVGYSEKQMHNLFKENPVLLMEGIGKKLYAFLGLSLKLGLSKNVIYSSFIEYPYIMSNKCAKNLLRVIGFLCYVGMETKDISHILAKHMHLLSLHPLKGPKAVCWQLKIGKADLCQIIKDDPRKLISLASKLKQNSAVQLSCDDPSKHLEKTTFLLKLGYAENSEEMAKAVKRFRGRGDQLQERFDCLVQAGLDYNIAIKMIKQAPMILNQNKVVIQKKIDFLRNILGYPLESVVAFPVYLCYDLGRITLRLSMYAWVKERKAAKPMMTLSTILASSEEKFVKYFVNVHPEGSTVWEGLKRLSQKD